MNASATKSAGSVEVARVLEASEEEKAEWARRYIESGLSLRQFSARHGMGRMALWRWVNKASDKTVMAVDSPGPAFTEIKLAPMAEPVPWVAELSMADGRVLRLGKEVPAAMLEQLLGVIC